ncbi:CBM96 family carbohydrate-binding protein [Enterobacillus tribolii]|uniref:Uncharacterized protein DUF1996 n=1 Tax=Enterobacillus tribolii TaxID=1487935 RepID=A0A370R308_9GAMM|nr:DUF1996 domain-containing protein [Enterobacillus tribolii]MBW7982970.1 DUF1996 domain-containing protein [Enterobacillus tribolii]RDK95926.1 uncharacterized protein DUF1996 [Enterobacillus tribolii]
MKYSTLSAALMAGIASFTVHAGPQAQATCAYHHTLGDDAIMMFGKPNQAMLHDFFGNTHTDAYSSYATLRAKPDTTCDNKADSSAYWVPTMKLPDGEIVKPAYQKTYYQASNVDTNPLTPFPPGLELLAGDHHGTGPNSHITFLCGNGKGYSNKAGEVCGLRAAGDAVQFNIGIAFPNCWDGVNLKPVHGKMNAAYSVSGACPADFPVKIPTVNMNIAWVLPQITSLDTSKIQLSMDPTMQGDQRTENWGGIYTAHADFMNGWTENGAKFMAELCMNNNMDCGTNVPYDYSPAIDDSYVSSQEPNANFGQKPDLILQDNWKDGGRKANPETLALVKFKIPPLPQGLSETELANFKYRIRLYGAKEESGADQIFFYPAGSSDWNENSVTWDNRPSCNYNSDAILYLDNTRKFHYLDVDKAVRKAIAAGKTEISWYIGGDRQGHTFRFNSAETKESMVLMLSSYVKVPEI